METRISKGQDGYKAVTDIKVEGTPFTLRISTRKINKHLATTASCHVCNGNSETHRVYQDYYARLLTDAVRVTEKAVTTQHNEALGQIDRILGMVQEYYFSPEYIAKYGYENKEAA